MVFIVAREANVWVRGEHPHNLKDNVPILQESLRSCLIRRRGICLFQVYHHSNNALGVIDAKKHVLLACMAVLMCSQSGPTLPCCPKRRVRVPLREVRPARMLSNKNTVASLYYLRNLEQSRGAQPYLVYTSIIVHNNLTAR